MILILRDFKPILNLDLYCEHMPEERITCSKIDLDLSARSTYTPVYMVHRHHANNILRNDIELARYMVYDYCNILALYISSTVYLKLFSTVLVLAHYVGIIIILNHYQPCTKMLSTSVIPIHR